jgi:hypothetical protein
MTTDTTGTPCRVQSNTPSAKALREAIAPYLAIKELRRRRRQRRAASPGSCLLIQPTASARDSIDFGAF